MIMYANISRLEENFQDFQVSNPIQKEKRIFLKNI